MTIDLNICRCRAITLYTKIICNIEGPLTLWSFKSYMHCFTVCLINHFFIASMMFVFFRLVDKNCKRNLYKYGWWIMTHTLLTMLLAKYTSILTLCCYLLKWITKIVAGNPYIYIYIYIYKYNIFNSLVTFIELYFKGMIIWLFVSENYIIFFW